MDLDDKKASKARVPIPGGGETPPSVADLAKAVFAVADREAEAKYCGRKAMLAGAASKLDAERVGFVVSETEKENSSLEIRGARIEKRLAVAKRNGANREKGAVTYLPKVPEG